jgi:hypothetical protein
VYWTARVVDSLIKSMSPVLNNKVTPPGLQKPTTTTTCWPVVLLAKSSHLALHFLLLTIWWWLWSDQLLRLRDETSAVAMGEIIICFSTSLATVQNVLLQIISLDGPMAGRSPRRVVFGWAGVVATFVRRWIGLCILITLETLFLWVIGGSKMQTMPRVVRSPWLWISVMVLFATHGGCLILLSRKTLHQKTMDSTISSMEHQPLITGPHKFYDNKLDLQDESAGPEMVVVQPDDSIASYLQELQIPLLFEAFMATLMLSLVLQLSTHISFFWSHSLLSAW